jgi:hypothetical protein
MTKFSLIERAAEIYDFASGAQLDPLRDDLPPPRARLQPARATPPVFPPARPAPAICLRTAIRTRFPRKCGS